MKHILKMKNKKSPGVYVLTSMLLFLSGGGFFGVFPLITFWGLLKKPGWKNFDLLNIYANVHWSWTYSLYCGIILVIWMDFEIMFLGYHEFIQTFYSFFGVVIIIFSQLPGIKEHYIKINNE